ncbi:GDSL-motif lipase 7 [Hibiscus trionum]|uniref:GDSL-motif lipase 7 n=1 Tax=Hibiscus trionum TaxID=183268 RepID=A0A9W7HQI1_HIBTR|nr:GDSL-motif lipase 7 [Hibiscus trionum]
MNAMNCILNLFLFLQIVSLGSADVVAVPPFNISKESILKYLSLDNITFDLPALYVFGDNFVDAGNNNYLHIPEIQSNYSPYGIDFGEKPTGRYTNGRTVADFIAQFVGLPFPPPVLSLSKQDKRVPQTGLNYASGYTGIYEIYENQYDPMLALRAQVEMFNKTTKKLQRQFGSKQSFSNYMSESLFFINAISFDLDEAWGGLDYVYGDYYYSQLILKDFSTHLQTLYRLGARKIVVNNALPIGCQPHLNKGGDCYIGGNERALFFNPMLSNFTKDLRSKLPGLQLVLVDLYKIFDDVFKSPASYGFTNVKSPCCSTADLNDQCIPNAELCNDRSSYVFFDAINPTESMHFLWARRLLKDSSVSYPINLIQLIQS